MLRRLPFALISLSAVSAFGQNAISAKSGMVHYIEGRVLLDGQAISPKFGEFPQVADNQTLCTEDGRAEVLLTPGVFLRLAEGSSFRMLSNRLSDTAVEILSGTAMLEVDELLKDNAITVHFKEGSVSLIKQGLYRFDADLSRLRVFDGDAQVTLNGKTINAKKGRQITFDQTLQTSNFDTKVSDPFYRWASRRSEYIATANVSSARSAYDSGLASGYSGWAWNPWYGMFTFLPGGGFGYNPFGWTFFSPFTIGYFYNPYYYGGGGYGGGYAANSNYGGRPTLGSTAASSYNGNAGAAGLTGARATPPSFNSASNGGGIAQPVSGGFSGGGGFGGGAGGISAGAGSRGGGGGAVAGGGARGSR